MIFKDLAPLGMVIDQVKNECAGEECIVSTDDSPVSIVVVPTNEEMMIALDTAALVGE